MTGRPPVIVPRAQPEALPLPFWVAPVALLGLAALCLSTLPAALRHRRLAEEHRRQESRIAAQREEVRRLREELRAIRGGGFVLEHALRDLLHPRPPTR